LRAGKGTRSKAASAPRHYRPGRVSSRGQGRERALCRPYWFPDVRRVRPAILKKTKKKNIVEELKKGNSSATANPRSPRRLQPNGLAHRQGSVEANELFSLNGKHTLKRTAARSTTSNTASNRSSRRLAGAHCKCRLPILVTPTGTLRGGPGMKQRKG